LVVYLNQSENTLKPFFVRAVLITLSSLWTHFSFSSSGVYPGR
jgi:hypothetical protein